MKIDWNKQIETSGGEPVKHVRGSTVEYRGALLDVDDDGMVRGNEYRGLQIRNIAWTGEGLPSVGTVCEFRVETDDWRQCEVIAHKDDFAICWIHCNKILASSGHAIRPIRTPEQIAAETEEREALEIQKVIAPFFDNPMGAAFALHRAGYRKQADHE